ncbi:hypothetical protein DFH09DRAFT_1089006 [Mycena vulgaris]|nr:hypothetical protein DFH09DRAFT_1089006 [Mycena vulgaris]
MALVKSVCGLDLPLDATFDSAAWRNPPLDLPIPDDMDLQERNQYSHNPQLANRPSIRKTRAYETLVKSAEDVPTTKDLEPSLRAYYVYTAAETEKRVSSVDYCTNVVGPTPPRLMEYILDKREKRVKEAERKKEEEKEGKGKGSELTGSMVMSKVTQINVLTRALVTTPELFLVTIRLRMQPSLFWFTDARLRFAMGCGVDVQLQILLGLSRARAEVATVESAGNHSESFLTFAQLPRVFLFASRNSPLTVLLLGPGVDNTKLNYIHRWAGRVLFLGAIMHGALWISNHIIHTPFGLTRRPAPPSPRAHRRPHVRGPTSQRVLKHAGGDVSARQVYYDDQLSFEADAKEHNGAALARGADMHPERDAHLILERPYGRLALRPTSYETRQLFAGGSGAMITVGVLDEQACMEYCTAERLVALSGV